jgi:hypothetical protein
MGSFAFNRTPPPGKGATSAPAPWRPGRPPSPGAAAATAWLARIPRRLGTRLFRATDREAIWRGWQTTRLRGGLARCYRDIRFYEYD